MQSWDVFISHASEDKDSFAAPLAHRLKDLAVRVWYDRFVLIPGDRLSQKIGEGLAHCRHGLLIVSKAFLEKPWPSYELSGLINRYIEEDFRLIPVWLDVTRQDVANVNPSLADMFAIQGHENEIEKCALEVLRVVRPQLYENLSFLTALKCNDVKISRVKRESINLDGPIRHHDLPDKLLIRIQNIWFAMRDLYSVSLEKQIENFQRDLRPEREVEIWERIVSAVHIAMENMNSSDSNTKKELFSIILSFSCCNEDDVFAKVENGEISEAIFYAACHGWLHCVPPVAVEDVEK